MSLILMPKGIFTLILYYISPRLSMIYAENNAPDNITKLLYFLKIMCYNGVKVQLTYVQEKKI